LSALPLPPAFTARVHQSFQFDPAFILTETTKNFFNRWFKMYENFMLLLSSFELSVFMFLFYDSQFTIFVHLQSHE